MGHVFTADGLKIDDRKVKALEGISQPSDVPGVRRLLGLANYMAKFVPNLSGMAEPLRKLTQEGVQWEWTNDCDQAVQKMKAAILTAGTLQYFDHKVVTVLQCDASSTGLGVVLMQMEKPVTYASIALIKTEENYCQLEKEMVCTCLRSVPLPSVHLRTSCYSGDWSPALGSYSEEASCTSTKKPTKDDAGLITTIWFEVVYRPGAELYLADTLPRAYLPLSNQAPDYDTTERVCLCEEEMEVEAVNAMAMFTAYQISGWKSWCEILQSIQNCSISFNWSNQDGQIHDVRYQCRSGPILTFGVNLSLQME